MQQSRRFIKHYLVSGPRFADYIAHKPDKNQIRYEQYLRSIVAERDMLAPSGAIKIGENSELGMPWMYDYPNSGFVNVSQFSVTPQKVDLLAATGLVVAEDIDVRAILWTYTAADVWLGEERICSVHEPVYKPIKKQELTLALKKGYNALHIRMQNLAIRDTRNLFGIELLEHGDKIASALPDSEHAALYLELDSWLSRIQLKGNGLLLPDGAPCRIFVTYEDADNDTERVEISGQTEFALREQAGIAIVYGELPHKRLARKIELLHHKKPVYRHGTSPAEASAALYRELAELGAGSSFQPLRFGMFYTMARWHLGKSAVHDEAHINRAIEQIARREDCSDFFLAGLLRLMEDYTLPDALALKAEQAILDYRYWMTEDGSDGMCFWSENHALMFYICAYMAGKRYPDRIFTRSSRTGIEASAVAKRRIIEWLEDVEEYGFEEFLSADYMCVTLGALLNVVDYMEEAESERAAKLIDRMLELFARHTFRGSIVAPQARIYRSVILPFTQAAQALLHILHPGTPVGNSEWVVFLMNSKYKLPYSYAALMDEEQVLEYQTGNAWIKLNKQRDYALTSVQSPRYDEPRSFWKNISFDETAEVDSNLYVKSFNERYHGTSRFEPGVHGYQQHMWYAALDNDAVLFTNHPGEPADEGGMRPGYWYGNGIMPAIKQQGSMLGAIYDCGDEHPVKFSHLFFPAAKFDDVSKHGEWLFARKGNGFAAIWSSGEMVAHDDLLIDCEYRVDGERTAYVCQLGSIEEFGSFELFIDFCKRLAPAFDSSRLLLTADGGFSLQSSKHENKTQFI